MGRSMPLLPWCQQYALEISAVNICLMREMELLVIEGARSITKGILRGWRPILVPFLALVSKRWHYDNANNDFIYNEFTYNIVKDVLTQRDLVISNCISSN